MISLRQEPEQAGAAIDCAVQIPLELLKASRQVVGLSSANLGVAPLAGALRTGFLTHLVVREKLLREIISIA